MIRLTAELPTIDASAGDDKPATVTGIAVPWAPTTAVVSNGTRVAFARGAFDVNQKPAKLLENHDTGQLRGVVNSLADMDEGLGFTATFARTNASADAIELVKAGAYDAVSVGAEPIESYYDKELKATVVTKAHLAEISLVAMPAFTDARITEIAAASPEEETASPEEEPNPNQDSEEENMEVQPTPVEAAVATTPIYATAVKREAKLPTAVEYLAAAIAGGDAWHRMSDALRAAAPDVVTTDTPGILPTPIVGPVYNNFVGRRPVVDAIGTKAMPGGGKIFIRPEVTTHTSMAVQSAENAALQAGTFVVFNNQVQKNTYGGYVTISEQDLDWTDPAVLSLILDDMSRIYANQTDDVAADALRSGTSTTVNMAAADTDDPSVWAATIASAASTILTASNGNLPTHLFVAPGIWQDLIALSDSSKRPLFPQIGPMNAFGNLAPGQPNGNAFGLQVVVDRNFASATCIIGDASGFEIFEQQKGAISIDNPSTISRTIAWRGYFATLMIDASKFVRVNFT
jgi:HK97 family phage prohead protease